jgi:hypothetical protein
MDAVFKNLGNFISGLVGLVLSLLALGIVTEVLLGTEASPLGVSVIDNITGLIGQFMGGGFVGLVALLVVLSFLSKK